LGILLVDLSFSSSAKLSFRFTGNLDYLWFTYWSLEAANMKKSLIIIGLTNWNLIKFGDGLFARFLNGFRRREKLEIFQLVFPINQSNLVFVKRRLNKFSEAPLMSRLAQRAKS